MPSLQDEKNTYTLWGWTWTANKEPGAVTEPVSNYSVSNADLHGDSEGDDLWTYLMMYRRTGNALYLNRANAWANYFKTGYQCVNNNNYCFDYNNFGLDHAYGVGLVALYESNGDAEALAAAERIGADVEALWDPAKTVYACYPSNACFQYGLRGAARHLMLATRLASVTGKQRWITLREKIVGIIMNSGNWDPRGMYFSGQEQTDGDAGAGSYAAGLRIQSPFMAALLVQALDLTYRANGNAAIRDRIVAMARFVSQYGLDPTYQYTASRFGVLNGLPWHSYSAGGTPTFWDPVYTTSLVNTLVFGYKYTGDTSLLDRAKVFFNRGTKGIFGSVTQRQAADNVVGHFVDTIFDTSLSNMYLAYNKGELQYTYLIFENGGNPTVE